MIESDDTANNSSTTLMPTAAPFVSAGFSAPSQSTVKPQRSLHALHQEWALWVMLPLTPKDKLKDESVMQEYKNRHQVNIYQFNTVEDFWTVINGIQTPSEMACPTMTVFKKDLDPNSDETCSEGGRWIMRLETKVSFIIDEMWIATLLAIIGEQIIEGGEHVAGAMISVRRSGTRIALWIDRSSVAQVLGKQFHRILQKIASGFNIALGEFHYEDFACKGFTHMIPALVASVPEDHQVAGDDDEIMELEDLEDYDYLLEELPFFELDAAMNEFSQDNSQMNGEPASDILAFCNTVSLHGSMVQ